MAALLLRIARATAVQPLAFTYNMAFPYNTYQSLSATCRVTLRPIDHQDGLHPVGLFFTKAEFNDPVHKQFASSGHYFHPFYDVDTLPDIVSQSYRQLKRTGEPYSWNSFLKKNQSA